MTDYTELVKALRCCIPNPPEKCVGCTYNIGNNECAVRRMMTDAADAIEELQQIADHYEQSAKDWWQEAREYKIKSAEGLIAEESKEIIKRFKSIPCGPIEQLPKRGEWKPFDLTYGRSIYSCSVCEQATEVPMCMEKPMYAYCPYCGAKMEVQDG